MPEMTPVESSLIAAIGYEDENKELHVEFKKGGLYAYQGVPHAVFTAMQEVVMTATDTVGQPRSRITHELKIWPEFFSQVRGGRMKFQIRRADRDYLVGDELLLREWDKAVYDRLLSLEHEQPPEEVLERFSQAAYTGRELRVRVDYISLRGFLQGWR